MNRTKRNNLIIYVICVLMVLLLFGVVLYAVFSKMDKKLTPDKSESTQATELVAELADQYLILRNDSVKEELYVYSYGDGKEYRYRYNLYTEYLDQYGDHLAVSHFTTGRVVTLTMNSEKKELSKLQLSDQVWEFTNLTKYAIDSDIGMLTIGKERYSLRSTVYFSDENEIAVEDITDKDELMVVGKDKTILSVVITTGHGVLSIVNSSDEVDFTGGYIQIGTKLFSKINGDMEIEIQEGTYTVSAVSPGGYGDVKEVIVSRGSTVTLDLADYQGEGPKKGQVSFVVDDPSALMKVDNEIIDISQPVELTYGLHSFIIVTDNYENYARYLFVNSEKAKVSINLSSVGTLKGESSSEIKETETESESMTETETSTENSSASTSTSTPSTSELISQNTSTGKDNSQTTQTSSQSTNSNSSSTDWEVEYYNSILSTLSTVLGQ